jgi:hypothetical protein
VAAWTGLWDVLDQSLLPALSESCILRAGFLAEYPCVLVKFFLIAFGAAGLHWSGTLYTIEEDMGAAPGLGLGLGMGTLPWQQQMGGAGVRRRGTTEERAAARRARREAGAARRKRVAAAAGAAAANVLARLRRARAARAALRAAAARARRAGNSYALD